MNRSQAERMLLSFQWLCRFDCKLMIGVMMSYKTLNNIDTRWKIAFPRKEDISDIFVEHPCAFNTLHYADYDGIDISKNLIEATSWGLPSINAIQLDMIWPNPKQIQEYHEMFPWLKKILQVNSKALEKVDNDPEKMLTRIDEYESIDSILLDKSMGRGLGMDSNALRPFIEIITQKRPNLGIAVAGGLGPDTLHFVEPLIREFPDLSIDAQGKLRSSGNSLDPIDWSLAEIYIEKAVKLFKQ